MTKKYLRIVVTFVLVKPIIINNMRRFLSALSITLFILLPAQATDSTWKTGYYGSWPFNECGYHVYANDTLYESEYRYSGLGYWLYPDSADFIFDDSTTMANIYTRGNGNKPKSCVMTSGNQRIAYVGNQIKYKSPINISLTALFKGAYAGETTITVRIGERPMDMSIAGTPNVDMTFEPLTDSDGRSKDLTLGTYVRFLESSDRDVRLAAYEHLYSEYRSMNNTISAIYANNVRRRELKISYQLHLVK